jgi:hypothetical protein
MLHRACMSLHLISPWTMDDVPGDGSFQQKKKILDGPTCNGEMDPVGEVRTISPQQCSAWLGCAGYETSRTGYAKRVLQVRIAYGENCSGVRYPARYRRGSAIPSGVADVRYLPPWRGAHTARAPSAPRGGSEGRGGAGMPPLRRPPSPRRAPRHAGAGSREGAARHPPPSRRSAADSPRSARRRRGARGGRRARPPPSGARCPRALRRRCRGAGDGARRRSGGRPAPSSELHRAERASATAEPPGLHHSHEGGVGGRRE